VAQPQRASDVADDQHRYAALRKALEGRDRVSRGRWRNKPRYFFEEIGDLHSIIEHGPDWNRLVRCTVTLNRTDDGEEQNSEAKARRHERT
jgi:hypothetical protein